MPVTALALPPNPVSAERSVVRVGAIYVRGLGRWGAHAFGSFGSFGSNPLLFSSSSVKPSPSVSNAPPPGLFASNRSEPMLNTSSPSVSGLNGLVPSMLSSSPSLTPSLSVSLFFASVPFCSSCRSFAPSPSVSGLVGLVPSIRLAECYSWPKLGTLLRFC